MTRKKCLRRFSAMNLLLLRSFMETQSHAASKNRPAEREIAPYRAGAAGGA